MGDRRDLAADLVAAVDDRLVELRAKVAVLERARGILSEVDGYDWCDAWRPDDPCSGPPEDAYCETCGEVFIRCRAHGGRRRARGDLTVHYADLGHTPAHEGRVRDRPAAVPVDLVQAPPTDHPATERAAPAPRPPQSPAVIRRCRDGAGLGGGGRDAE